MTPSPDLLRDIIQCGGGEYLPVAPSALAPAVVVLSCPEDNAEVLRMRRAGLKVMDKEFILTGVLKYKLDKKLTLI